MAPRVNAESELEFGDEIKGVSLPSSVSAKALAVMLIERGEWMVFRMHRRHADNTLSRSITAAACD